MDHKTYKKVVLVICDGFGVAPAGPGNAVSLARTPHLDSFVQNYPSMTLQASGPLVGLPWGEMGNSEVGHLNIGAGRIVGQDLPRITSAIQSGEFFKNSVLTGAVEHVKAHNSALHIMGLLSSGGVHSFDEHMYALLGMAGDAELKKVYIHVFTDGRDTSEKVALETLKKLEMHIANNQTGEIATVTGRFYAMDRGGHWSQTTDTYNAMVRGTGEYALSAEECIRQNYASQIFDEMIKPTVIVRNLDTKEPVGTVKDGDAVVFANFRPDRALQLTQAFVQPEKLPEQFRKPVVPNLYFATMTEYEPSLPVKVAFPPMDLKGNLAEVLSQKGFTQFHIAESEKYAHVTIFFNCGQGDKLPGEERAIVTSPENNARNYVDSPQMSAGPLTEMLVKQITETDTNFFVANFANCDMVGHTGNLKASIEAVEFVDTCLGKIAEAVLAAGGLLLITADHGNVEQMLSRKTGDIDKDHTTNPVPLLFVAEEFKFKITHDLTYTYLSTMVPGGVVSDIAPTILDLYGLPKSPEMTGINLFTMLEE